MAKILLDMDGVIADFYKGFGGYLNEHTSANLDLNTEPLHYSLHEWGGHDVPRHIVDAAIPQWIKSGGYSDMPVYDGAVEFVNNLAKKHDVYIVTARVGDFKLKLKNDVVQAIMRDTYRWLNKHNFPIERVFFEHEKIDFCKRYGINIMIEDKLSTVVQAANSNIKAILINRGWNQEGEEWNGVSLSRQHPNIYVAQNYKEILGLASEP